MILIGRYLSPFTRRVAVSLKILGIPFERRRLSAWQNLDDVRRSNPVGRVPALVLDDGEVLFDSTAILDHLDERAGPEKALLPPGGAARREALRIVAVCLGIMEKAAAARYEGAMRPEEKVHEPWIEHNLGQARSGLEWLDRTLAARGDKGSGGGALTQAEIAAVVTHDFLGVIRPELVSPGSHPALEALVERTRALPAFAETHPDQDAQ